MKLVLIMFFEYDVYKLRNGNGGVSINFVVVLLVNILCWSVFRSSFFGGVLVQI